MIKVIGSACNHESTCNRSQIEIQSRLKLKTRGLQPLQQLWFAKIETIQCRLGWGTTMQPREEPANKKKIYLKADVFRR